MKSIYWLFVSACFLVVFSCSDGDDPVTEMEEEEETMEDPPLDTVLLGEITFSKNLGGSDDDFLVAATQATDGGFVMAGYTKSTDGDITDKTGDDRDVWVIKTTANGAVSWSKTYGGSSTDEATSISKTSDGGYIVAGYTRSNDGDVASENAGFNDLWALKLAGNGDLIWENTFGYAGDDRGFNIKQTNDGGYLMLGVIDVTASGGEGNIFRTPGRGTNHAGGDYWAVKLDAQGQILWARYYGGLQTDTPYDFIENADGSFILIGSSDSADTDISNNKGAYDFWVLNIAANGTLLWEKNFGGSEIDLCYSLAETTDGNFIVVGDTRSSDQDVSNLNGNADVWAVKFNRSGNILWENTYGGSQFESARSITPMANGYYSVIASSRSSDINVGNNNGVNDAWFFVIDEEGTLLFEKNIGGSQLDFGQSILETATGEILLVGDTESSDGDISQNKGGKDAFIVKIK